MNNKYDKITIEISISCRLNVSNFTWRWFGHYCNNELIKFDEEQLDTLFIDKEYTIKEEAYKDENVSQGFISMTFRPSTLKEHMQNILAFERVHRPTRIWFGSIDESHVYYEGLRKTEDGSFKIIWGS